MRRTRPCDSKVVILVTNNCVLIVVYYNISPRGANDVGSARALPTGKLRHWKCNDMYFAIQLSTQSLKFKKLE